MLDMGFRPAVDRIVKATPTKRQTMFFSATLDGEVGRIADAYTSDARSHTHAHTEAQRGDVEHRFVAVRHEAKLDHLVEELKARELEGDLALVFVRTKRGADRLVKRLKAQGVHAVAMHGDKTQSQREKALARFERGDVTTLVATDVAARGLDVEGITHVINFDAPGDHEDYVHRVGRTARAGATGVGITFVMHDQASDVGKIARTLKLDDEFHKSGLAHGPSGNGNGNGSRNGSRGRNRQQRGYRGSRTR
jgi:superfamily II DNA/RNA helicase